MRASTASVALLLALCLLAGCNSGGQPSVRMPGLNPDAAGRDALAQYDANKDGFLDAGELKKCPALEHGLAAVDRDRDGKVSAKEIADRLRFYQERKLAITDVGCHVTMDTKGLPGATVTFIPEKWMGPEVKQATGVTDEHGMVALQMEGESLPGLNCGFYRVSVSKKDAKGKETVPARYNDQTTLGYEVAPDMRDANLYVTVTQK